MIQEFHVSNFYSIREKVSISFLPSSDDKMLDYYTYEVKPGLRLLKLGIIYGANASGKTTILEAISFFRDFMVTRPDDKLRGIEFYPFKLDNESCKKNSFMEMSFFIDGEKYVLSCEFNGRLVISERLIVYTSSRPTLMYKRDYSKDTGHSAIAFGSKIGLSKKSQRAIEGNTINNCSVMAAVGQSNVEKSRLDKVYKYFSDNILEMLSPGMSVMEYVKNQLRNSPDNTVKSFLLKVLKASDFNIVDFYISDNAGMASSEDLIFMHSGDGGDFNLNEELESAGTKRFLGMSVILYRLINQNCFFPIDEVETSIHYELFSYFIKVFLANSDGSSQLLMTTHDINLLDEDFIRRDVIWFTVKDMAGSTSIKRLSTTGLHKTMSVYNAYRQGKLVELPFLGSIFLDN
ncbi:MAG: ATP-binding protein [Muribaculaceae bacterium]|nr:ATP-binding protein [Muribaculaceae bacterium]